MFPCRLKPLDNRSRLLLAGLTALGLHIGLGSLSLDLKPVPVTGLALSRKVNIFLRQVNSVVAPTTQTKEADNEPEAGGKQAAEPETLEPPRQIISRTDEKVIRHLPAASALQEYHAGQPAAEEDAAARQGAEAARENARHQDSEPADTAPPVKNVQTNDSQAGPAAMQTAYPRYRVNRPPPYPDLARKRGQEGTVILQVLVDREGRAADLRMERSSGFSQLDRAAIKAVKGWIFEPGRQGDQKVEMWVRLPVTFRLEQ